MTAAISSELTPSRRALLGGALGGLAAWLAVAAGRGSPVHAEGEVIHVGDEFNTATSTTKLRNQANNIPVLWGESAGAGAGVIGSSVSWDGVSGSSTSGDGVSGISTSGDGVFGHSNDGYGIEGSSNTSSAIFGVSSATDQPAGVGWSSGNSAGLQGFSGPGGPPAKPKTGVHGYANQDDGAYGVFGESEVGIGVHGLSTDGIGLLGVATGSGVSAFGLFARSNSPDAAAVGARSGGDSTAVLAKSGTGTFPSPKPKTAVYGYAAQDNTSRGLWGESPAGRAIMGTSGSGYAGYFAGKVYTSKFHEMTEITAPAAPGANKGRLFLRDNGSGKTQLCIRFSAGAIQVLATQP